MALVLLNINLVNQLLPSCRMAPACGFVPLLAERLRVMGVLWDPFEQMSIRVGRGIGGAMTRKVIRSAGPALAVAAGLAMRTI